MQQFSLQFTEQYRALELLLQDGFTQRERFF